MGFWLINLDRTSAGRVIDAIDVLRGYPAAPTSRGSRVPGGVGNTVTHGRVRKHPTLNVYAVNVEKAEDLEGMDPLLDYASAVRRLPSDWYYTAPSGARSTGDPRPPRPFEPGGEFLGP